MGVVISVAVARFAHENHEEKPEHVKSRKEGREDSGVIKYLVTGNLAFTNRSQYLILGPKPGQGKNSGDGQIGDEKGRPGDLHLSPQPAHFPNILVMHAMDDASRPQEQEGFKTGVGG